MYRSDIRLIRRAAREGWNVPAESLELLPLELQRIALQDPNIRNRLHAIRALDAMLGNRTQQSKLLLDLLKFENEQEALALLKELKARLDGIDGGGAGAEEAGGGDEPPPPAPGEVPG